MSFHGYYGWTYKKVISLANSRGFEGNFLDRSQAVALLKELIRLNLIQSSFVSIDKNKQGTFSLNFKCNDNIPEINVFLVGKDLVVSEDKEKGTCSIYSQ